MKLSANSGMYFFKGKQVHQIEIVGIVVCEKLISNKSRSWLFLPTRVFHCWWWKWSNWLLRGQLSFIWIVIFNVEPRGLLGGLRNPGSFAVETCQSARKTIANLFFDFISDDRRSRWIVRLVRKFYHFFDSSMLSVSYLYLPTDPNEEYIHWLECIQFAKSQSIYSVCSNKQLEANKHILNR